MTAIRNTTGLLAIAATLCAFTLGAAALEASGAKLKSNTGRQQVTPVPCNSVSACNQIIAYCAANNGTWVESSHNGGGQPSKGTCYLP